MNRENFTMTIHLPNKYCNIAMYKHEAQASEYSHRSIHSLALRACQDSA